MVNVRENLLNKEIMKRNGQCFRQKVTSVLDVLLTMSKYRRDETLSELGLGTQVFVTLVLGLANKDLYLCVTLLQLAETISPLLTANRYMVHQMLETFQISPRVIQGAVEYLELLEESRLFNIPDSIGTMLRHAADIVIPGQSDNTIPSNEISSAVAEISEEQVECIRTEPSEAVEVCSEREEAVQVCSEREEAVQVCSEREEAVQVCSEREEAANDIEQAGDVPNQRELLEIVDFLIQNGADPNITDDNEDTPLFAAASNGQLEIIRKLVNNGADIIHKNRKGFTVLYQAVKKLNRESAILLKELGANLCFNDISDAAACYEVSVMEFIKELGADIIVKDSIVYTPLHWAVITNNEPIVRYLVEVGANPNSSDSTGWTPLQRAVSNNNEPIVRYLVESGANPNASDSDGRTPLHWAVLKTNEPMVRYLVESGANPNTVNRLGNTPLTESCDPQISAYLRSKGAQM